MNDMKTRSILALLLFAAMLCALLAGCGGTSAPTNTPAPDGAKTDDPAVPAGETDKTVYISIADGDPGTLDPFVTNDSSRKQVLLQVYETLFHYDIDGNLVGVLAKGYERNGRDYDIELYDNIYDAAGNHFTADDVIWCLDTYREKVANSDISNFESWEKTGDYSVRMTVKDDGVTTFYAAIPMLWMVTKAAYDASGENMSVSNVVTTAHYQVKEYTTGSTLVAVKNENYWQPEDKLTCDVQKANVDTIVYNFMEEAAQIVVALESGTLDFAFVDFNQADRFMEGGAEADRFTAREVATWGGNDLWFNESENSVFKDNVWLRRAILYAIDREAIIEATWNGHAINPKTYGQVRYPDVDPDLQNRDYFEYDPEYALECLGKSGVDPSTLSLTLMYPSSSYCDSMCTVIQAYLENNLGITIELAGLENAIYNTYNTESDKWDLLIQGGGGSGSITNVWRKRLNRNAYGGAYCLGFINDDKLQELYEAAADINTNGYETTTAVHEYLVEQAYVMRLYVENKCIVFNNAKIADMYVNIDMRPLPGATTYSWN